MFIFQLFLSLLESNKTKKKKSDYKPTCRQGHVAAWNSSRAVKFDFAWVSWFVLTLHTCTVPSDGVFLFAFSALVEKKKKEPSVMDSFQSARPLAA